MRTRTWMIPFGFLMAFTACSSTAPRQPASVEGAEILGLNGKFSGTDEAGQACALAFESGPEYSTVRLELKGLSLSLFAQDRHVDCGYSRRLRDGVASYRSDTRAGMEIHGFTQVDVRFNDDGTPKEAAILHANAHMSQILACMAVKAGHGSKSVCRFH